MNAQQLELVKLLSADAMERVLLIELLLSRNETPTLATELPATATEAALPSAPPLPTCYLVPKNSDRVYYTEEPGQPDIIAKVICLGSGFPTDSVAKKDYMWPADDIGFQVSLQLDEGKILTAVPLYKIKPI